MGEFSDRVKGKAKEVEGALTGDEERRQEGLRDQVKGNAKGVIRKIEDAGKNIGHAIKDAVKGSPDHGSSK